MVATHGIPRPIPVAPSSIDGWLYANMVNIVAIIRQNAVVVIFYGRCLNGYSKWYYKVLHPLIIPLGSINPSNLVETLDEIPPLRPTPIMIDQQKI